MKYVLLTLTLLVSMQCEARNRIIATVGYAIGGETIISKDSTFLYDRNSNQKLEAGQGLIGEFGTDLEITDNMAVRLLIGQKIYIASSNNADHEISSNPASALFLIRFKRVTFGAGLTYHIGPKYTAEGTASSLYNDTARFDDAIGFSTLINIRLTTKGFYSFGIRYTAINYEGGPAPQNFSTSFAKRTKSSYSANNLAIMGIFKF